MRSQQKSTAEGDQYTGGRNDNRKRFDRHIYIPLLHPGEPSIPAKLREDPYVPSGHVETCRNVMRLGSRAHCQGQNVECKLGGEEESDQVKKDWRSEAQRIKPVHDAAVAGDRGAEVFDTPVAFDRGHDQAAEESHQT